MISEKRQKKDNKLYNAIYIKHPATANVWRQTEAGWFLGLGREQKSTANGLEGILGESWKCSKIRLS